MADGTAIEWTHRPGTKGETWNPIVGCSMLSPGCTNCYAMKMAYRITLMGTAPHYIGTTKPTNGGPVWTGKIAVAPDHIMLAPLRWKKPRTVFVNSMSDLFHPDVPDEVIDRVFAIMALAQAHTFIVLTKRSGRMRAYMAALPVRAEEIARQAACLWPGEDGYEAYYPVEEAIRGIPSNVWLGVSAERQREADERIPDLLATPAAMRFVSAEPLLGHLNIEWSMSRNPLEIAAGFLKRGQFSPALETLRPLDQVIVGGESGRNARPMNPNWARSIRDQCTAAGTAFFFKQWGQWAPEDTFKDAAETYKSDLVAKRTWRFTGEPMRRRPKHIAGRLLDGVEHNGFPETR